MTSSPALSVLIPNYNYGRYIRETIDSVLVQPMKNLEVVVADNASTDNSVEVVRAVKDDRVRLTINPVNVGFAANLERVAAHARGHRMLLLSSDDRMRDGALGAYERLEAALGAKADTAVWGSSQDVIDSDGNRTGRQELDGKIWGDAKEEPELSAKVGHRVISMPAATNLRRSLELLRTSLAFATICYPRALHDRVGGYAGGRLMNPDKWFLWKLLAVAETVYAIDHPLFEYRVHNAAQGPQEQRSGALKHLTDQYISSFDMPSYVLEAAGMEKSALAKAFVEHDIALRGLVALSDGRREAAQRSIRFGQAAYPDLVRRNAKVWALRALVQLGPLGTRIARSLRGPAQARWSERESQRRK
jgi:hypothetical protein